MNNKIIAFKVVRTNRTSMFAEGKYKLTYNPNETTKAILNTVGIMAFDKYENAEKFISICPDCLINYLMIIKIEGIPIEDSEICFYTEEYQLDLFYDIKENRLKNGNMRLLRKQWYGIAPPQGTLFFNEIKVLD